MVEYEQLYNPITKESFTILKTSANTCVESIMFKYTAYSTKYSLFKITRKHPKQTEVVNVLSGCMVACINGKTVRYEAGEMLVIKRGEAHRYWNGSGKLPLELLIEIRPALQTLEFLKLGCSLADIRNKGGVRSLYLADVARLFKDYTELYKLAGKWGYLKKVFYQFLMIIMIYPKNVSFRKAYNKKIVKIRLLKQLVEN